MNRFITGNQAVAEAVRLARPEVIAAYPITPQTPIYEKLSEWEARGLLPGVMMRVESEHSALAACLSASLAGVRTFTATSSQGLALMHEMLHFASGCRAAVIMAVVNRTLAAPWGFWPDQTDSLAQRDTGWLQLYCEDNQEALDSTLQAFRIAERLLLPVMVVLEAHYISHFLEPTEVPEPAQVEAFLPPASLPRHFEEGRPGFHIPVVSPAQYQGYRRLAQEAMVEGLRVVEEVDAEFGRLFGRSYGLVEAVACDEAELVLVTAGSMAATARTAVENLRRRGLRVGLCKLRLFRPFPVKQVRAVLDRVPRVAVLERNISLGREGIFCAEVKAALHLSPGRPRVQGFLAGLGGTDVPPELIERAAEQALAAPEVSDEPVWLTEAP
jgi:pyruvate/2-oxoacid:ferredoxin oxidoreductase alpha subunit